MTADSDRLRDLLDRLGMSQREAARLLGIPSGTLRAWARGQGEVPRLVWVALEAELAQRQAGEGPDQPE